VVLVILAVIWAIVLIPPMIRAKAEGRPGDSITNFRQQLAVLRRTGPRMGGLGESRSRAGGAGLPMASVSRLDAYGPRRGMGVPAMSPRLRANGPVNPVNVSRQRAQRRRRDILVTLLALALGTLVIGLVPGLRMVLLLNVVVDLLLVAYVALLIHQRTVAAEREMKVRFLPGAGYIGPNGYVGVAGSGGMREPALLRRSANQ